MSGDTLSLLVLVPGMIPGMNTYLWYQVGPIRSKGTAGILATAAAPGTFFPVGIKANHGTR